MKLSIKLLAITALLFSINFSANAQERNKKQREKPNPTLVAQNQTDRMMTEVGLEDSQLQKVQEINLAYAAKMEDVRSEHNGDREAIKAASAEVEAQRVASLKDVLTDKQFVSFSEMKGKGHGKKKGVKKGKCEGTCKGKTEKT